MEMNQEDVQRSASAPMLQSRADVDNEISMSFNLGPTGMLPRWTARNIQDVPLENGNANANTLNGEPDPTASPWSPGTYTPIQQEPAASSLGPNALMDIIIDTHESEQREHMRLEGTSQMHYGVPGYYLTNQAIPNFLARSNARSLANRRRNQAVADSDPILFAGRHFPDVFMRLASPVNHENRHVRRHFVQHGYTDLEPPSVTASLVSNLLDNYEPIIIESEDSNGSTIPDGAAAAESAEGDTQEEAETETESEPPTKIAKMTVHCDEFNEDESDGQTCSICLDTWTVSGSHRLTALKCGHLFGLACIERWLKQMTKVNRCCPTCKARACTKDIRHIYAKRIAVLDNSEVESLRTEIETTKSEKNRVEMELQKAVLNQQLFFNKITRLEREITQLKQACREPSADPSAEPKNWTYTVRSTLDLVPNASCRVMAYNTRGKSMYVTQMSTNNLFPGFGVRRVNCFDWKLGKLVYLHPKLIRDACYSGEQDMLITVSLDKTVKLVQGTNDEILYTIPTDVPLWSCCWDESNVNRFFVGGVGGIVLEYDIRQPRACITRLLPEADASPVASLANTPNGVLACHLNSFRGHLRKGSEFDSRRLPVEGSLLCVRRNPITNNVLISCRPSCNFSRNRHIVCSVDLQNDFEFTVTKNFEASTTQTLMARSAIFSTGGDENVAAHSESHKSMYIWSVSSKKSAYSMDVSDNIVDILPIPKSNGYTSHIVALTQTKARVLEVICN